jgi:hypothetical protein
MESPQLVVGNQARPNKAVMRGLDPRIHQKRKALAKEDGLPGQARQ